MVLGLSLPATSNPASSVRVTPVRTEVPAKKAGIDSSVTALALVIGPALVREVNMCDKRFHLLQCIENTKL